MSLMTNNAENKNVQLKITAPREMAHFKNSVSCSFPGKLFACLFLAWLLMSTKIERKNKKQKTKKVTKENCKKTKHKHKQIK